MNFHVLGIGTAVPPISIRQEDAAQYAAAVSCRTPEDQRLLKALYRKSGVKSRQSVVLCANGDGPPTQYFFPIPKDEGERGPTIADRMALYEREALPLAEQAAVSALENAGVKPERITHIVTASCSGFFAPGIDTLLLKRLGLCPTVERTHVGFMGCHGALNALRVARSLAASDPDACVLLCAVELCSLHYHYGWTPDQIVANAIFADGAAALVGAPEADRNGGSNGGRWSNVASGSCILPESEDAMTWRIRDHGFEMSLSTRVPDLISSNLRPWVESWLGENDLGLDDVRSWAVHPGGTRILSAVESALELDNDRLGISRGVLSEYGNMSSPTVLFILERLRAASAPRPCVALGFGPGLAAEAALFR